MYLFESLNFKNNDKRDNINNGDLNEGKLGCS